MATFIKAKNGWKVQLRLSIKGNKFSETRNFKTKQQASNWAIERENEIRNGKYHEFPNMRLGELIDRYMREFTIKKRGASNKRLRLNKLCEMNIASVLVINLTLDDFKQWRDERLAEVSGASVLREWNTLSNLLNIAVDEWGILETNFLKK